MMDTKHLNKIVIIGPVYPYKSGISHYTGLMVKNFRQKYETILISFKMQYPKILFKNEQKAYGDKTFMVEDAEFIIDTANPFNWKKAALRIHEIKPDIIIFQWWHPYFVPCYRGIIRHIKGIKLGFICHDVFPKKRFLMDTVLTRMVLSKGDFFITHSAWDLDNLISIKPDAVCERSPHPTYNTFRFTGIKKEEAGKRLGFMENGEKVLLFFGFVEKYKGLKSLIKAMPYVLNVYPKLKLLIVGEFKDKKEYLHEIHEQGIGENIKIFDGYVQNKDVEIYFAACDLVVLPYNRATQSGIAQIAYGFEKPVIATDVGGLPEVVTDGLTGYIVPHKQPKALADAILRYFDEGREEEFVKNVCKEAWRYEWDRMRETVERLARISK